MEVSEITELESYAEGHTVDGDLTTGEEIHRQS